MKNFLCVSVAAVLWCGVLLARVLRGAAVLAGSARSFVLRSEAALLFLSLRALQGVASSARGACCVALCAVALKRK